MNYIIMLVGGLLGIFLHSLVKVRQINRRLSTETYRSVFAEYWRSDWSTVLLSFAAVITAMFISTEFLDIKEDTPTPGNIAQLLQYKIATFIKTTFVIFGYCADSAISAFLSVTEKKLKDKALAGGIDPDKN